MITRYLPHRRPINGSQEASQASASDVESTAPSTAGSQESSLSSPTPHRIIPSTESTLRRAVFTINWDNLWKDGEKLKNAHLRPITKEALSRSTSYIWQHGANITADGYPNLWVCKICHLQRKQNGYIFVATSTNRAQGHLETSHSLQDPTPKKSRKEQEKSEVCSKCGYKKEKDIFNARRYKQAYIDWVIHHNISFQTAVASDTRNLLQAAAKSTLETLLPTSHSTVSTWVMQSYIDRLPTILYALQSSQSKINISCDGWKGSNNTNYIAICAHFINSDFKQDRILIGFPKIYGAKSGENEASHITKVLATFEITASNLGAFTMDNAPDNDVALKHIEAIMHMPDGWSKRARIRCLGHIINLVVKALLFGVEESRIQKALNSAGDDESYEIWAKLGVIGRLHNICMYINRSSERRQAFRALQEATQPDLEVFYVLLIDGGIRWHATYEMIARAIKLRDTILRWQRQWVKGRGVDISTSFLTHHDFTMLEIWASMLKDFKQLCLQEEENPDETTQGTVAGVVSGLTCLWERIKDAQNEISSLNLLDVFAKPFNDGLEAALSKTMKYFSQIDESNIYYAAIILNPNYRLLWFEDKWSQYDHRKWFLKAKRGMETLFNEYCDSEALKEAMATPSTPQVEELVPSEPGSRPTYYAKFNRLSDAIVAKKRKTLASKEDELTRYIKYWDPADWDAVDPLAWWFEHRNEYPILARMAFDVLSIPGMSAEVERIFSTSGRLITDSRNGLSPDVVEAASIQHHGLKNGLFTNVY